MNAKMFNRKKIQTVPNRTRTEAADTQVLEDQRAIARMLTSNPREMLAASNAFLCGWLARENAERKQPA